MIKHRICLLVAVLMAGMSAGMEESISDNGFKLGAEAELFSYKEPGVMDEAGLLIGLSGAYDRTIADFICWGVFGSLVGGELDYDGSVMHVDGTESPLEIRTPNTIFNLRAQAGPRIGLDRMVIVPYVGLGYRLLVDDLSENSPDYGYTREQTYVYMPIGARLTMPLRGSWMIDWRLEYDYFLNSENTSHGDVLGGSFTFSQDTGYGLKLSAAISSRIRNNSTVCLEAFLEHWDVEDSEIIAGFLEPANHSTMLGLRVSAKLF